MTLCEELYFEITLTGAKSDLKKFISFLKSGELDDFFEFSSEYISYDDEFEEKGPDGETSIIISNDDWGIEIDEFDTDEFLEVFCRAAKEQYAPSDSILQAHASPFTVQLAFSIRPDFST